jgi:hypothetical protein
MADIEKIEDSYGNIERYYKNQGRLTKREQELVERWETAWSLLRANRNKIVAQKKYKSLMLNKGIILSDNDVYRDFRYCVQLFAPISTHTKDFLRLVLTDAAMKRNEINERRARKFFEDGKTAEYEKLIKLIQKDEELIMKINGLDTSDPDMPDFSKVEMTQININIDSNNSKIFQRILGQGAFDMNEITYYDESQSE